MKIKSKNVKQQNIKRQRLKLKPKLFHDIKKVDFSNKYLFKPITYIKVWNMKS